MELIMCCLTCMHDFDPKINFFVIMIKFICLNCYTRHCILTKMINNKQIDIYPKTRICCDLTSWDRKLGEGKLWGGGGGGINPNIEYM